MPSHAFLRAGASHSCHLAEDAYSAVARARARWNCVAHNLSSGSAQGGIPTDKGWNSTPSRLACAPCMGGTSERSTAPVFIATPHLKCSTFLRIKLPSSASLVAVRTRKRRRNWVEFCPCPWDHLKFSISHTFFVGLTSRMANNRPSGDGIAYPMKVPERSSTEALPSSATFSNALSAP